MAEFAASIEWGRAPTKEVAETALTRVFRQRGSVIQVAHAPGAVLAAEDRRDVDLIVDHAAEVAVVASCRLDNQEVLRERLRVAAHVGGARLLLCAYLAWRNGFPDLLRGDFSGVVWDWRTQHLVGFRDALGIRPLFYAISARGIVIASDVQIVLAGDGRRGSVDDQTIIEYLTWNYQSIDRTYWTHVHRLHGGHVLVARPQGVEVRR